MNILRIIDGKTYTIKLTRQEMQTAFLEQREKFAEEEIMELVAEEAKDFPDDEKAQEMLEALNRNQTLLELVANKYIEKMEYSEYDYEIESLRWAYGYVIKQIEEVD